MKKLMMVAVGAGAMLAFQGATSKPAEALGWWGCGCKSACRPVAYRACGCKVRHYRPRKCGGCCGGWWW